jgi:hypothetical protein
MIVPAMTNLVLELHRAGKLGVLEVTHGTRLAAAPELPTAVEQGLTDLVAPNFVGVRCACSSTSRRWRNVSRSSPPLCSTSPGLVVSLSMGAGPIKTRGGHERAHRIPSATHTACMNVVT